MIVELSNSKVKIKDKLTWGEVEDLSEVLYKGAQVDQKGLSGFDGSTIREAKYRLLEICILEIDEGGKKKQFSRDWINGLSPTDGDKLVAECEKLKSKKE
jgi:hypothetical protein